MAVDADLRGAPSGYVTQYVLGLNAFHGDSAAALFADGNLLAAAEEERFRRIKHWAGFPSEAIRYCLKAAGISLADVGHVAVNTDPTAQRWARLGWGLCHPPSPRLLLEKLSVRRKRLSLADQFSVAFADESFAARIHPVEHHLSHLASAFLMSPFEHAAVVSVDGFGDFASGAWGWGEGNAITVHERTLFPHSLGVFYQALTQYLGFPHYGDEYKVMGMAAYGQPVHAEILQRVLLSDAGRYTLNLNYFRHARERIAYGWDGGEPAVGTLYSPDLEKLLGPARQPDQPLEQRHKDLAASIQNVYEQAFFGILNTTHRRYGGDRLSLAGGCAMNSLANGKIAQHTPFKQIYVQAAAGDAGGAIGAAAWVASRISGQRPAPMTHANWGAAYSRREIEVLLQSRQVDLATAGCTRVWMEDEAALCKKTAERIAAGHVVGWFQGRMEWGPRALGNRSIVGDPCRADMKDILNLKIKRRESFRPFAPSVLREHVAEWFEQDGEVPFMSQVFMIRAEKRALIPAVTHVDGSGRLQTVSPAQNPRYHALIRAFHEKTGVPMVLNTSFNENEPVVCTPEQALNCFLRTRMDVLVLGDCFIERSE